MHLSNSCSSLDGRTPCSSLSMLTVWTKPFVSVTRPCRNKNVCNLAINLHVLAKIFDFIFSAYSMSKSPLLEITCNINPGKSCSSLDGQTPRSSLPMHFSVIHPCRNKNVHNLAINLHVLAKMRIIFAYLMSQSCIFHLLLMGKPPAPSLVSARTLTFNIHNWCS